MVVFNGVENVFSVTLYAQTRKLPASAIHKFSPCKNNAVAPFKRLVESEEEQISYEVNARFSTSYSFTLLLSIANTELPNGASAE